MLKQLISLSVLAVLSTSTVTALAATDASSSVANMLLEKKNKQNQESFAPRLTAGQLNSCNQQYNRCVSGLISNINTNQCYAAYTNCLRSGGNFDLPSWATNPYW